MNGRGVAKTNGEELAQELKALPSGSLKRALKNFKVAQQSFTGRLVYDTCVPLSINKML